LQSKIYVIPHEGQHEDDKTYSERPGFAADQDPAGPGDPLFAVAEQVFFFGRPEFNPG
jgi:hypothetical protein